MVRDPSKLVATAVVAASLLAATGNDNSALVPEIWANESIAILEESMVMGNLVYRDFENAFAQYGETVNTRKPSAFKAKRKTDDDDVTEQPARSTNIPVVLNQWIHVSFRIKDGEKTKAFKDLVTFYLQPALIAQAQLIDKIICAQAIRFTGTMAGHLGLGSETTVDGYTLDAREALTRNRAPDIGRNLMLTSATDTMFQKTALFISAEKRGDQGSALETAVLGRLHNFVIYSSVNQPAVPASSVTPITTLLVNNAAGYPAGTTTLATDGLTGSVTVGEFVSIAGDETPQRVTATSGANPTSITITPGLVHAVADNAIITRYDAGAVNQASAVLDYNGNQVAASGYLAGHAKDIAYDNFTITPSVGSPVSFGDGNVYTIVDISSTTMLLDRPLVAAILDGAVITVGPPGNYNLAFLQNALALVVRPLSPPDAGLGALSSVAVHNNFAVRVTITYDGKGQGTLVTVDSLCGVAVLEPLLGCLVLS